MSAERCPVCYGTGKYTPPPDPNTTSAPIEQTCHGCGGKGWVNCGEAYPRYANEDGTVFCRYCGTAIGVKDIYDPDVPSGKT